MSTWNQAPLVRFIFPFIAGIITAIILPLELKYGIPFVCALALLISIPVLVPKLNISYRRSWGFGVLVNITFFLFAYQLTIFKTEKFSEHHFSKLCDSTAFVYVQLTEPYLEKQRSVKVPVEVMAVKQNNKWKNTCGKAMLYFKKDEKALRLNYGDGVVVNANFIEIPPPQNPGEFNYKRFLSFHNVYHQAYVKSADWLYSGVNTGNVLKAKSIQLRNELLKILTEHNIKGNEFAVGSALLLGYEDKLDADIISAYSSTGTLHILSVSGLHVAIVYLVFNWLLFFFYKIKYGGIIKAVLLLLLLWFYAALTGLSPSVLRAATMFSFIVIAKAYNRNTNIYNTLSASAFLLLLIDPFLIMDVGFQLSYIAVIGIIAIQPKIQQWWEPKTWLMEQVWSITSVSIAAQIATFPLALYYFHQFPNYFLVSNLIVIPASTAVIYLGVAMFSVAKISAIVGYLAIGFNYCVWFLNQTVFEMEKWPYALISGISISILETLLIYAFIAFLFYYFIKPTFKILLISLSLLLFIGCSQISEQIQQDCQKKFIVYNVPKISALDFISARTNVLLTDSLFSKNETGLSFRVKNNWYNFGMNESRIIPIAIGTENIKTANLMVNNNFIQFFDKRIVLVNEQSSLTHSKPLPVDYVIISKNKGIALSDILKNYPTKMIVFDSSNSQYLIDKWKEECDVLKQSYYSVVDSGAMVVEL